MGLSSYDEYRVSQRSCVRLQCPWLHFPLIRNQDCGSGLVISLCSIFCTRLLRLSMVSLTLLGLESELVRSASLSFSSQEGRTLHIDPISVLLSWLGPGPVLKPVVLSQD